MRIVSPLHRTLTGEDYVFTLPWGLTGWPTVSVPAGVDDATGLPVAVQVAAPRWQDHVALAVAEWIEAAPPNHPRAVTTSRRGRGRRSGVRRGEARPTPLTASRLAIASAESGSAPGSSACRPPTRPHHLVTGGVPGLACAR